MGSDDCIQISKQIYIYIFKHVYVFMYIYVYIYIYIYIYMHGFRAYIFSGVALKLGLFLVTACL